MNAELISATKKERFLILSTFLAMLLLNISAFNQSIGPALLGYLCIFSLSSPFSALLALSASQVVADPVGVPLTLGQSLFVAWGLHFFVSGRRVDYGALQKLLKWTLPYILIAKILIFIKWDTAPTINSFDLAVIVGAMAAWYVGQLRGRFLLGFICIALGASASVATFWLGVTGIAIEGITASKSTGILEGVGLGRGDGNFSGISISLAAITFLALGVLTKIRINGSHKLTGKISYLCIGFFLISTPPIFATMSRGAVLTFFGGLLFVIISALYLDNLTRVRIIVFGFIACIVGVLSFNESNSLTKKYSESMLHYSERQIAYSIMMSRSGTWEGAWKEIANSPLIGTTPETQVWVGAYEYNYASHNVWLDVGRGSGVLGMLWFTAFFFYPLKQIFRFLPKSEAIFYCSPFVVLFLVFMNLSLINLKVFYALWVLAVAAARHGQDRVEDRRLTSSNMPL